jgi:hypothetical protein
MRPQFLIVALAILALCALASCHTAKQPEHKDISSPPPAPPNP